MTPQQIIIAVAELDEPNEKWETFRQYDLRSPGLVKTMVGYRYPAHSGWILAKPYTTSRDAIIPVIEKVLDKSQNGWDTFCEWLETMCGTDGWTIMSQFDKRKIILATPQQLCEALLRATGKWKD